jgi:hypothetical protein
MPKTSELTHGDKKKSTVQYRRIGVRGYKVTTNSINRWFELSLGLA